MGGFSFGAHFVWEFLHAPLYRGLAEGSHVDRIRCCLLATLGDVVIALVAYGAIALVMRDRFWLAPSRGSRGAELGYVTLGVAITVAMELLSVAVWRRWAYTDAMPTIGGVGLSPLLQWLAAPPLVLWLAGRHLELAGPATRASCTITRPECGIRPAEVQHTVRESELPDARDCSPSLIT